MLDHLYSTYRDAYRALPRPPFGKSDHNSILLSDSVYKNKWSEEADAKLQDCLLSQTGTCSGIYLMALRSTPYQ